MPSDPLIAVVPSILKEVLNFITIRPTASFLSFLNLLAIDHDTLIPPYFNDQCLLIHLAFLLSPQIGGSSLEKIVLDYVSSDDEEVDIVMGNADAEFGEEEAETENEDKEVEILDEAPAVF